MNLSYSQINLINYQNMIVLAPACKGNALNFSHRKLFPEKQQLLDCLKKNKTKLEWAQNIRWKLRWPLTFKVKTPEGEIRMLGSSSETWWSLSVCSGLYLCLFLFAMEHLALTPLGVQRLPVLPSTKNFAFRKGVIFVLGALPLSLSGFFVHIYCWRGRFIFSSWRRHSKERVRLFNSQRWC